jgi:hypothetical protein
MNATVGNTVTGIALQSLPSLNRDVSTFITLQPGVSPDGSVAGAVVDQSTFQLDGGQNTNDMDGSMSVYTTSFAGDPTGGISNQSFAVAAGATGVMPTPAERNRKSSWMKAIVVLTAQRQKRVPPERLVAGAVRRGS